MQVHLHYFSKSSKGVSDPAVKRQLIEHMFIEDFHWLPQDIAKIPYIDLQRFFIIRGQKQDSKFMREEADAAKKTGSGSGQMRRG